MFGDGNCGDGVSTCGSGNEGSGGVWNTCTCEDGSTYECKSNRGDGDACCHRSMPAICSSHTAIPVQKETLENNQFDAVLDLRDLVVGADRTKEWHECVCKDGSTYEECSATGIVVMGKYIRC